MTFFEQQAQARRASRQLLLLFALSVVVIVAAVDLGVLFAVAWDRHPLQLQQHGVLLLLSSAAALGVIAVASLYRMATLRQGGAALARQLGAVPVPAQTTQLAWQRLRNVVEEMAIASGVAMPEIYVLEQEATINAFAAGHTAADAVIVVTQGALDALDRDELQGVVAHEFSHLLNGDARLNMRLIGLVFGILALALAGRKILEFSGRSSRSHMAVVGSGLGLLLVGSLGLFGARLIKAAVGRRREFLADASAVQFTRLNSGISGALKKIAARDTAQVLALADGEEVTHMLFAGSASRSRLLASHPPISERIRRLDPHGQAMAPEHGGAVSVPGNESTATRSARHGDEREPLPAVATPLPLDADAVSRHVANPRGVDIRIAATIRASLDGAVRSAADDREQAPLLLLALSLSTHTEERGRQLQVIEQADGAAIAARVAELARHCDALHPLARLPLAQLALPRLRALPIARLDEVEQRLRALCHVDGRIDLAEYCLMRLLHTYLADLRQSARPKRSRRLAQCHTEVQSVLSVVALHGHATADGAERAFRSGLAQVLPGVSLPLHDTPAWMQALDYALPALDGLEAQAKGKLIRALVCAIGDDGQVVVAEAEILRLVCACLHCPLPPMIADS